MLHQKQSVSRDGVFAWHHVELRRSKLPPRLRHFAVSNKTLVEYVAVLDAVCPERLKIEGIRSGQNAGTGQDFGRRCSLYRIKFPLFGANVVFRVVGIQNVARGIMFQTDVTARIGPVGVGIEIDLVRTNGHFGCVNKGPAS